MFMFGVYSNLGELFSCILILELEFLTKSALSIFKRLLRDVCVIMFCRLVSYCLNSCFKVLED